MKACYTSIGMSPRDDNVLDRAEAAARRFIERLGAKSDRNADSPNKQKFAVSEIEELVSKVEDAIESGLNRGKKGSQPVAPNSFTVLLTYEESAELSDQVLEALSDELKDCAIEFINNRRYATVGPVSMQIKRDVFAKAISIRASFESNGPGGSERDTLVENERAGRAVMVRTLKLGVGGQPDVRLELALGGAPSCIGRAAGNAVRLDDESVSRIHCSIVLRSDGQLMISDLKSANGTTVNGRLIEAGGSKPLCAGDRLGVGDVQLKVIEIA